MRESITHFMWGFQQHFRASLQIGVERVLDSLHPEMHPDVFLIGVRVDDDPERHPACVEPEVHHWAESADFYSVLDDVTPIQEAYPEAKVIQSHPVARENQRVGLSRRALRDAILRRLEGCKSRPSNRRVFASIPIERDGFLITTCIAVNSEVLAEVPAVTTRTVWVHKHRSFDVPCSFVQAAIEVLLTRANEEIIETDAGANLSVTGSADEILRRAGIVFFTGLLMRGDDTIYAGQSEFVFDTLSRLCLMPYEGHQPTGALIIADKDDDIGIPVVTLAEPIPFSQIKALRKLLVMANRGRMVRCDSSAAYALVNDAAEPTVDGKNGFIVRVEARGKWSIVTGGQELMAVSDGIPTLPKPLVDEGRLAADLRRVLPTMTNETATMFAQTASCLATAGHGALLVIAENAPHEAARLQNDSLPIQPITLVPELPPTLTEIDGAVLCGVDGRCHAIGVILDGLAVSMGDRGRGARFNSAIRYVASQENCVALVVSEDGGLDIVPKLMPVLKRAVLLERLNELQRLATAPADPVDREREAEVISWIEQHKFYLNSEQCRDGNDWIRQCDERWSTVSESSVTVVRSPLVPNAKFNPERDLV